jgi:hypothetical protein
MSHGKGRTPRPKTAGKPAAPKGMMQTIQGVAMIRDRLPRKKK